jgi:hypothetical protein
MGFGASVGWWGKLWEGRKELHSEWRWSSLQTVSKW